MSKFKEKVAARKAKKQAEATPVEHKKLDNVTTNTEIDTPEIESPAELMTEQQMQDSRNALASNRMKTASEAAASVADNPLSIPSVSAPPTAQAQSTGKENGLSMNAGVVNEKPKTFADYLAESYKNTLKEKTDAQKMQQYYALADAFNAIGKMGGAAIGGAVGGDALGGAPNVGEYKESRGYIDAFERAKQANEKLRAFDDKNFQLALREDDRAYADAKLKEQREYDTAIREADKAYKAEQDALTRDWQLRLTAFQSGLQQAIADKNFAKQAKLKKEMLEAEKQFKLQYQANQNRHDAYIKNASKDIVRMQTGGNGKQQVIVFDEGEVLRIPNNEYYAIVNNLIGRQIGGRTVTKDNVGIVIQQNPNLVKQLYGYMHPAKNETPAKTETTNAADLDTEEYVKQFEA